MICPHPRLGEEGEQGRGVGRVRLVGKGAGMKYKLGADKRLTTEDNVGYLVV